MAVFDVKQNWSGSPMSIKPPWTASLDFTVMQLGGVPDEKGALAAVPYQLNDKHPQNPTRLRCDGPFIKEIKGPLFWVVSCPFSEPPGGVWADNPDDPLLEPPIINWSTIERLENVDHDLENRVIANSAGDIQTSSRVITYKRLEIIKRMPFYDILLSKQFENTVNKDVINLSGTITVAAQHLRCAIIEPASSYHPKVEFVNMRFLFDVMAEDVLGKYPFQHRLLDAGRNGWSGTTPNITSGVFKTGINPVDFEVKLDGTGKPLTLPYGTTVIKVGPPGDSGSSAAVAAPVATKFYQREYYNANGATIDGANTLSVVASVFNYFVACKVVDFGPLTDLL